MLRFTLELNKIYIDANKDLVTLVKEFTPHDADYVQGFRFRGDNGTNYKADGTVVGQVGVAHIMQLGASPIVAASEGVALKRMTYYRNKMGRLVMILDQVDRESAHWKRGYRFFDHRGSLYRQDGSTNTGVSLYDRLDLIAEVPEEDISLKEIVYVRAQTHRFVKVMGVRVAIEHGTKRAGRFISRMNPLHLFKSQTVEA